MMAFARGSEEAGLMDFLVVVEERDGFVIFAVLGPKARVFWAWDVG